MKSSLSAHVASGVTDKEIEVRRRRAEAELHHAGIGLVPYDDQSVPWELRHRVETEQAKKFGARRR
ncbi:MAG: hypothetical protein JWO51_162 [Rhodospirillales bacterium]|nr:hypothetical protein [Rhodospirillales bacterium]